MISPIQVKPDMQLRDRAEAAGKAAKAIWEKRRPAWTRSDTERWLNDRSEGVLAWLRRVDAAGAPGHSAKMGRWLKDERADFFGRAHERLAACGRDEAARAKFNVLGVLS